MIVKNQLVKAVIDILDPSTHEKLDDQVTTAVFRCIQSLENVLEFHQLHPELIEEEDVLRALQYLQEYKKHLLEIKRSVSDIVRTRRLESLL